MASRQTKRLIALGIVVALIAAAGAAAYVVRQQQRVARAEQARVDGMAAYEQGDYQRALPLLQRSLRRNKDDGEALYAAADARRRIPAEAGAHIAQAASLAILAQAEMPEDPRPVRMLLELYLIQSRNSADPKWTEVVNFANRLSELEPGASEAVEARIEANLALGRAPAAVAEARGLASRPDATLEDSERLLNVLVQSGAPEAETDQLLSDLSERYPDALSVTLLRLQRAVAAGDADEAAALADVAQRQEFTRARDAILLVRFVDVFTPASREPGSDPYAVGDRLLERAVEQIGRDDDLMNFAALRAWRIGQADPIRWLKPALDAAPSADVLAVGAVLDQWQPEPEGVVATLRPVAQGNAGLGAWVELAEASRMLREGKLEDALAAARVIGDGGAAGGIARYIRATALLGLNRPGEAREQLEWLFQNEPFEAVTWRRGAVMLAELHVQSGQPERAVELLAAVPAFRAVSPGTELYAEALVATLEAGTTADVPSSMRVFEELAQRASQRPLVWAWLARARVATGDLEGAEDAARQLATLGLEDGARPFVSVADRLPEELAAVRDELLTAAGERALVSDAPPPLAELLVLADRLAGVDQDLSTRVLGLTREGLSPTEALSKAVIVARGGDDEGARRLLDELVASAPEADRPAFERARATLLAELGDPTAGDELLAVANRYPSDSQAQIDALTSPLLADRDPVELAPLVARLRDRAREGDTSWRRYDAELKLRGEPSDQQLNEIILSLVDHLRVAPSDTQALLLLSEARRRAGDDRGSIAALERAIAAGGPAGLRNVLVRRLVAAGRTEEADERLLEFAQQPLPAGGALAERASLLETRGFVDLALRDRAALAASGGVAAEADALAARGRAGEAGAALAELAALAQREDLSPSEIDAVARAMLALGASEDGLALLERLPESSEFGVRSEIIAGYLMRLGRFDDAIARLDGVRESDRSVAWWMMHVRSLVAKGAIGDAVAALDRAMQAYPGTESFRLAREALAGERSDDPLRDLAAMVPLLGPESSGGSFEQFEASAIAYVRGEISRAAFLDRLARVTGDDPTLFSAWRMRVIGVRAERGIDAAIQTARAATEASPIDPRLQLILASLLFEAERYTEAIPVYREWIDLAPERRIEGVAAIALCELSRGRADAAVVELSPFRREIEQSGRDSEVALLAQALATAGRTADARSVIGDRGAADPRWWNEMLRIAGFMPAGAIDARRSWVREAEGSGGQSVDAASLAEAWFELAVASGNPEDIRIAGTRLEALVGSNPTAERFAQLAVIRELEGDVSASERAYREALTLAPENPVILNNLAYIIHDQPGRAEEAVALAQRALAIQPSVPNFADTLGQAQLAAGQHEAALKTFSDAIRASGELAMLLLGQAEAHLALEQRVEASALVRSLSLRRDLTSEQQERLASLTGALEGS